MITEKMMISNKYELGSVGLGIITSTWFSEALDKVVMTSLAMVAGTTVAFFWRRFLHKYFKNFMRNKNNNLNN